MPDRFASEVIRPAIGIAGYIVAVACGWLIYPLIGVAIFILIVAYYAATSTGIRTHPLQTECTSAEDNTEAPTADDRVGAVAQRAVPPRPMSVLSIARFLTATDSRRSAG